MDIKKLIKDRRNEKGLTLKQVAELVGVSESTVSRWESGDIANMTREKIVKLANALNVSPALIMGWETEEPPAGTDGSEAKRELIALIDSMTEEQAAEARHYLEFLKNK